MTEQRLKQVQDIAHAALGVVPEQRAFFLDRVCGLDRDLRTDVEREMRARADQPRDSSHEQTTAVQLPRGPQPRAETPTDPYVPPVSTRRMASALRDGRFVSGDLIGERYRIVALLGRGGMGEVYRADDLTLGQSVALKFLPESSEFDPAWLDEFLAEVRTARQISHPNVCRVHDIERHEGRHFISMEYVQGETLDSLLKRAGRLSPERALAVARELCDGLGAIHDCGVLHRDFKPANVLIDREGHPRITDFGLAAPGEAGGRIEGRAAAAGTPGYIAPEAIAGRECTKRSDIYALGLVLFEVFTGRRAYSGDSGEQLLKQQETIDPPVPSEIVRDIDPLVERVILRCVERDPLDRPESVKHISRMLPGGDPLAAAIALGETPSPEVVAASGQVGRMPAWAACGVFALILVGVAVLLMLAPRATLVGVTPLEMSPEVLTDRAKQILHDIGYKRTPASSVSSLDYYQELMGEIARAPEFGSPGDKWKVLHGPRPTAIDFWYRQSLSRLTPVSPTGRPTWTDPSPIEPGMIGVRLSTGGLLRELSVMPYDTYSLSPSLALEESEGATPRNIDETWDLLFRASGLDRSKFEEATPARVPPQFADARAAWRGVYPDNAEIQIRVEAAALRGLPVSFRVVEERWSRASELAFTPEPNAKRELGAVLEQVVQWVSLVGALVLARHNWNRKRGDRESARRLGIGAFVFSLLGMLLTMRVIDVTSGTGSQSSGGFVSMRAADVLRSAVGTSIFSGAWLWLFYIAIEPMIRRTWPETLISWARLQAARWRDPLVGKSILLGVGIGVLSMVLIYVEQVVPRLLGESAPPLFDPQWGLLTMEGTRVSVGVLMLQAVGAMRFALIFLMGLVLIRLVVRSAVWAAVLFSSVQTIVWSLAWGSSWAGWPIFAIVAGICTIVVVRLGLLSLAVAFLSAFVLLAFPLTLDTSAWYADNAALGVGVVMTLAVLGTLGATGMFSGSRLIAGAAGATSRA